MWEDAPVAGGDPAGIGAGPAGCDDEGPVGGGGGDDNNALEAWRRRQQRLIEALHGVVATFDRKVRGIAGS